MAIRILLVSFVLLAPTAFGESPKPATQIDVVFAPEDDCRTRIIQEIDKAQNAIHVHAYYFTSAPLGEALLNAKKRGVKCDVVLDKSQRKLQYSSVDFFANQGIPVFVDDKHSINHNKVIIIDGETVITGSFNFTKSAENNAENVLIINDHDLAMRYFSNFSLHKNHSTPYESRSETESRAPPVAAAQSSTPQRASSASSEDPTVFVTKSGSKYHSGGCSYLRKSSIPMKLSQAAASYGPCSRCHPPRPSGSSSSSRSSSASSSPPKQSSPSYDGRCTAITKKGTRCKRNARSGGRCWQHGG